MSPPKLLISESDRLLRSKRWIVYERRADVTLADLDPEALLESICDAEVLWVRLRHRIDSGVLDRASRLRFIASPTTGLNHIDLEDSRSPRHPCDLASRRDRFPSPEIRATAEHTMGLIFGLLRNLPGAAIMSAVAAGIAISSVAANSTRKQSAVVGYGRLGRLVANYLHAHLRSSLLVTDPNVEPADVPAGIQWVSMESFASRRSEIVTLHVNLCEQTQGFFGRDQFAQMRTNAWLVNTSRGELLDESALLESLSQRQTWPERALDVSAVSDRRHECIIPLVRYAREHRNLLITPHIGGCTTESMAKTEIFLAEKLCAALQESSVQGLDERDRASAADLEAMVAAQHHRGPDGNGVFIDPSGWPGSVTTG